MQRGLRRGPEQRRLILVVSGSGEQSFLCDQVPSDQTVCLSVHNHSLISGGRSRYPQQKSRSVVESRSLSEISPHLHAPGRREKCSDGILFLRIFTFLCTRKASSLPHICTYDHISTSAPTRLRSVALESLASIFDRTDQSTFLSHSPSTVAPLTPSRSSRQHEARQVCDSQYPAQDQFAERMFQLPPSQSLPLTQR